jgi:osmotically-inducible protein OsmY
MNNLSQSIKRALKTTLLVSVMGISGAVVAGNNDRYQADEELHDAWLDGKVETALLFNTHLNNFTIDTDVKGNVVHLTGTVQSEVDKNLATEIAKSIEGVTDVKNNLKIDRDTEMHERDYYPEDEDDDRSWNRWYNDATTTASIKSQYLWNDEVEGLDINVDTMNGVVTLNGEADSSANKNLAEKIAQNTEGVRKVVNNLTIDPEDD